jgi:alkaline phosphatase D
VIHRRAAAIALGALFGGAALHRVFAPARAAAPGGADPFTLGVASGIPRPGALVLWTRLAPRPLEPGGGLPPAPIEVRWELAEDEAFTRGLRRGVAIARPEHAHSVHVEVADLRPDARFFYRFRVGDALGPIGRTRTAPAADASPARLRLALASCQHYEQGHYAAHRDIAGHDLDAVLFVGDYIYESSNPRFRIRSHEAAPPRTLDDYRARHALYKRDAALQAAHAAHPWLLTWDDHEVENDYAGATGSRDGDEAAFLARRAAAYKAYFEHLPVSPTLVPRGPSMTLHGRLPWGRLAEVWTLDARQYRDPQACGEPGRARGRVLDAQACAELADPRRSMLGAAQERWLAETLRASPAAWKIVAQASQLAPGGLDSPLGPRVYSDGWDGYGPARERLLAALGAAGGDLLCLGGDLHRNVAADLRLHPGDAASPVVATEFVGTSVTSRGLGEVSAALLRRANPDLHHLRSDERGWALVEIGAKHAACSFRTTAFPVLSADAPLGLQARFAVEAGRPGVQAA